MLQSTATASANFFRPWSCSSYSNTVLRIKHEESDDETKSEPETTNDSPKSIHGDQPLDLLSDFVNQAANEINAKRLSDQSSTIQSDNKYSNDKLNLLEFCPLKNFFNSVTAFRPNFEQFIPQMSYESEPLNTQRLIALDCLNQYAVQLQGEVNLLHQQDMAAKQLKKLRPKKYKCEHCNNAFSNKGQLKGHTRIHTGERPYKCDHCGKTFTRNEELTRHKKIHTGDKPHKCSYCSKCFGRKDHLKKHTKTHERGNYPYTPAYFPNAIPYIPPHTVPSQQATPMPVTYMYPYI